MDKFIDEIRENRLEAQSEFDEREEEEIIDRALDILRHRLHRSDFRVTAPIDATNYFKLHLGEREAEAFCVMFLTNQHGFLGVKEMFRGTIDGASVHPREVVRASMAFNAAAVIFAHNHPSGMCEPSHADKRITERLKSALDLVDVRVLDHIVVAHSETYSFAEHGLI